MRSQRWRLRAAVTGATVLALVAATGPTGSAAPPSAPAGPAASGASTAATATSTATGGPLSIGEQPLSPSDTPLAGGTKVTLITGDVVTYAPGADGRAPQVKVTSDRGVSFTRFHDGDHYYVYPSDARGLVGAGKLDKALFDVAYLAANGYADDQAKQLPVIVQYPKPTATTRATQSSADTKVLSTKADALPATTDPKALPAARSALVQVTKVDAATFWNAVDAPAGATGSAASTLDAGVAKIWLDHRVTASLDVSVPQIGAPQAWAAGYDGKGVKVAILDTGIDANHPDLAGKVIASKSFVDGESVQDGHGHGTHVASTIVGSGAASDGKYKGVAPGAQLIIGKVLDDTGHGGDAGIIAGMQWAAEQGADVVSMSLGGALTDGTDPMSETVDELSAQYGVLFVIAAGNNGAARTVAAPGTADAALTVAAVDKQDKLASFSSRGPRIGDFGLKPDIAAPGVRIVAARAEGTTIPGAVHVGDRYTTVSGTSMATPHVAGAAAILAQQHPDWTGQKLKQVLVSTTKDDGYTAYEQGSGRVDVARATTQQVYATGNVDFGLVAYPQTAPASKTLTYANDGDAPVTLDLAADLRAADGTAHNNLLTVTPTTLTVPAHGTAEATVALDTTDSTADAGKWYSGAVHATGAGVVVNTAVGGYKQPKQVRLSLNVINRDGATHILYGGFLLLRLDDQPAMDYLALSAPVQSVSGALDAGYYSFGTDVSWIDRDGEINRALLTNPTVDATKDVSITFDLRRAEQVVVDTPKPSVPFIQELGYSDMSEHGRLLEQGWLVPYGGGRLWSLPMGRATKGTFGSYTQVVYGADPVRMAYRENGPGRGNGRGRTVTLHPKYQSVVANRAAVPKLAGRMSLPVVFAGRGQSADFDGLDVTGKLVLLDLSDICPAEPEWMWCTDPGTDRVQNAARAGAAGVLGYGSLTRQFVTGATLNNIQPRWPAYPIPTMGLTADEGRALTARLARGPLRVDVDATPSTPYLYPLTFVDTDRMVGGAHTVTARNLHQVDHRFHADQPAAATFAVRDIVPVLNGLLQPSQLGALTLDVTAPGTMTTYYGPIGAPVAHYTQALARDTTGTLLWAQDTSDLFDRAGAETRNWGEQPLVPNTAATDPRIEPFLWQHCYSCRNGDVLSTQHMLSNDGRTHGALAWGSVGGKPVADLHLYKEDGTEIPRSEGIWIWFLSFVASPYFTLPAEDGKYRMTEHFQAPSAAVRYAGTVGTERTFTSRRRDDGFTRPGDNVGAWCSGWFLFLTDPLRQVDPASQPCSASNELFLGYDFGLDLDNTRPAGARQTVTVTGLHSPFLANAPKLASLKLWLSYDDGRHWNQVTTRAQRDGTYTAAYTHPALSRTTGAVTVRAEATDTAGNTVRQTITRAYGLKAPTHGRHGGNGAAAI